MVECAHGRRSAPSGRAAGEKGHAALYWGVGLSLHEQREHGVVHLTLDLAPAT